MKRIITITTMAALVAVMVFSIGKIVGYHAESVENQNNIKELVTEKDSKAENYIKLKEKNPDTVGWIKIPGTKIDYPVMWTPDNPEKYLRADFNGDYALCGLPFVAADCRISANQDEPDCTNTLIYGHHMQDGTMFAELVDYEKQDFADKHRIIEYDRIFGDGSYKAETFEVIAAFKTEVNTGRESEFKYYKFTDLSSEKQLRQFVAKVNERNLIVGNTDVSAGAKMLTLSTCSYHVDDKNGRFVVISTEIDNVLPMEK